MKKSFILYFDYRKHLDLITDNNDFRILIEAIFDYNEHGVLPQNLSPVAMMAFSFIKTNMDRDNDKYQNKVVANRENGKKGGRPTTNPPEPKKPTGLIQNPPEPKKPDTVTDTDTDTDTSKEKYKKESFPVGEVKSCFDRFYAAYPKHISPAQAETTFSKVLKKQKIKTIDELNSFTETLINSINLQITEHKNKNPGADYKYWQNPSTWLNAGGWLNEVDLRIPNQQQEQQQQTPKTAGQRNVEFMDWLRQKKLEQINQQKIRG